MEPPSQFIGLLPMFQPISDVAEKRHKSHAVAQVSQPPSLSITICFLKISPQESHEVAGFPSQTHTQTKPDINNIIILYMVFVIILQFLGLLFYCDWRGFEI